MHRRILAQVQQTCQQIILRHKVFTQELLQKIKQFASQPKGESSRTKDVVKSVDLLLVQYLTVLEVKEQLGPDALFLSTHPVKLSFARYFVEETLRRSFQKTKHFGEGQVLLDLLFPHNAPFIQQVFARKRLEVEQLYQKSDNDD